MKKIKQYAVTGETHGCIIFAKSRQQAECIFKKHYPNEVIWMAKRSYSIQF